jgi:hypothetical protein
MKSNQNKVKLKNHKLELLSLSISFIPIIGIAGIFIMTMMMEIFLLIPYDKNINIKIYIAMNIFFLINIIGLAIGIMSLFKKEYKKTLAIRGIILNSIIPILMIVSVLTNLYL